MDVCLADYGHCNFVSPKHACIFYDEVRMSSVAVIFSATEVVVGVCCVYKFWCVSLSEPVWLPAMIECLGSSLKCTEK